MQGKHEIDMTSGSLAAVGSTGSITNFVINLFMGLAVGTNVVLARGNCLSRREPARKLYTPQCC